MNVVPIAEDPLEILVRHTVDGTSNASPQGIAIIGWLCDFDATEPAIAEIIATSDGCNLARHSGEVEAEFLGPPRRLLRPNPARLRGLRADRRPGGPGGRHRAEQSG